AWRDRRGDCDPGGRRTLLGAYYSFRAGCAAGPRPSTLGAVGCSCRQGAPGTSDPGRLCGQEHADLAQRGRERPVLRDRWSGRGIVAPFERRHRQRWGSVMRHLLGTAGLNTADAVALLDTADELKHTLLGMQLSKLPTLRGRTVVTMFYQNSTRTRDSFDIV